MCSLAEMGGLCKSMINAMPALFGRGRRDLSIQSGVHRMVMKKEGRILVIISVLLQRLVFGLNFCSVQSAIVLYLCLGAAGVVLSELSPSSGVLSALRGQVRALQRLFQEFGLCGCPAGQRSAGVTKHTRNPQQASPGGLQLLRCLSAFSILSCPWCSQPKRCQCASRNLCKHSLQSWPETCLTFSAFPADYGLCHWSEPHCHPLDLSILLNFHKACFTSLPN